MTHDAHTYSDSRVITLTPLSQTVDVALLSRTAGSYLYVFSLQDNPPVIFFFFLNDPATTEIYPLPHHDALPIYACRRTIGSRDQPPLGQPRCEHRRDERINRENDDDRLCGRVKNPINAFRQCLRLGNHTVRSEEHTSELQSPCNLVCRLLLEKKK